MAMMSSTSEAARVQTIRLLDQMGADISGRGSGEEVRGLVEHGVTEVVFDLAGVESMSPSFADEVFGKLAQETARPSIRVVNAADDIVALIRFAVRQRTGAQ
jgi:hypothetical protein